MPIIAIRATYTEQNALESFLTGLFGRGQSQVLWRRGRYQCIVPRPLTQTETESLHQTLQVEHYEQA